MSRSRAPSGSSTKTPNTSDPKSFLRPAWNSSSRLGYSFDLTMGDGSDRDSDDDGERKNKKNSKMLTEDEVHNMRKFLTDENDAAAAASPLYERWEDINPSDRALHSDEFWGRWMVCTPPSYSTRPDGMLQDTKTFSDSDDSDVDSLEEWQRMGDTSRTSSPRRLPPMKQNKHKLPDKLEAKPEFGAAAMSQKDNLVKKWTGSLRRAGNSPRDEDLERPYCCECGKVEVAKVEKVGYKHQYHQLVNCKQCDFIYCRDCWRLVHKYGTMRSHMPGMMIEGDSNSKRDYSKSERSALLNDLMSVVPEQTGIDGKTSFFDRMHKIMEENGRANNLKSLSVPYGASSIVVRSGVKQFITPRESYVRNSQIEQFLPEPSSVRRGGGKSFNKAHFGLGPKRMAALHNYLSNLPTDVEEVDLTDNRLDDKAMAGVIRCLKNSSHLKKMRLSQNCIQMESANELADLIRSKKCELVDLDISSCQINSKAINLIAIAIANRGNKCMLEKLNLSENKIRGNLHAKIGGKVFGRVSKDESNLDGDPLKDLIVMLQSKKCTINDLILAGNPIGDGGGVTIAKAIKKNRSLISLDLKMSGLDNKAAMAIGDALRYNSVLESLDVSYNRYGDRGASALAAGIRKNETLQNINASHTHISEKGVCALLAAVETLASGGDDLARNVRLDGTDLGLQRFQQFDVEHPTGKYFLDLSNSYERAIVMQLLTASKQHRNILWKGPPQINGNLLSIKAIEAMHRGLWKPPKYGCFEFNIQLTGKRVMPEKEELDTIYKRVKESVKNSKGKAKLTTLAKLASSENMHVDMAGAQELLSYFKTKDRGTALLSILPCLLNHEDAIKLAQKNLTKKDQVELDNSIGLVFGFSPINPTGRYRLDLNDFYQRLVAQRCLQISNNEGKKCRRSGAGDTSQHGNYMAFRNESLGGRMFQITHDQTFPPYRTLSFDFVSSKRAPLGTKPITTGTFTALCKTIGLKDRGGNGSGSTNLKSLLAAKGVASVWKKKTNTKEKKSKQMVSPQALMAQRAKEKVEESESCATTLRGLVYTSDGRIIRRGLGLSESEGILLKLRDHIVQNKTYFSIDQLITLLDKLPPQPPQPHGSRNIYPLRIECIIAIFARLVDGSDFTYRVLRTLNSEEQDEIVHRIGWLKLFDPYHPEGLYKLHLDKAEDRKMALLLLHVCAHEEAFFWKDTTMNSVPLATIPSKWSRGMPLKGRLILTIDKDPNVESEYESDSDYSDEGNGYIATPRKEKETQQSDFFRPLSPLEKVEEKDTNSTSGARKETEENNGQNSPSESSKSVRKVIPSGGNGKINAASKITFSSQVGESTNEKKVPSLSHLSSVAAAFSSDSGSTSVSNKKNAILKPKIDKSRRRRRLTAMTKQHVMPSTLHGSLVIQDRWEVKRAKKKIERQNRDTKAISYSQQESSSDDYSSSDEDTSFGSLLNIEREDSSEDEDVIQGFQPDDTVFAGRVDSCDSESFYDDKVLTEMLDMDWDRCILEQPKVAKYFLKQHKNGLLVDATPDVQNELLNELLDAFRKYKSHLYNTFDFYAVMGNGSDAGQIQMNQYSDWCDDCRITESNNVPQCNRGALDRIFIVTNREDGQEDDTADANDDRALMRFEFLEVIVRIAIAKFIQRKKTDSLVFAVKRLLQDHINTNRGEGSCNALIDDPTEFRKKYVYTMETDKVLRKSINMLNQMFRAYCKQASKGMLLSEWIDMLKDLDFFNYDFTSREGKLAFVWSKSRVIDEVKGREKIHRMNFYDFLEGLLRIAQLKSLPSPEDITKLYMSKEIKEESLAAWISVSRNPKKAKKILSKINRRSSEWGAKKTRPHHVKLQILLDIIKISCDEELGHTEKYQISKGSRPTTKEST